MPSDELGRHKAFLLFDLWTAEDISLCPFYGVREYFGLPDYINFLLARIADSSLCCHRYIAPIISYPHAHIQVRPLVDSPAGRKAVDILLCIVDRQRKGADFDVVIRVKFAICIVSGSQIPAELIL